MTQTNDNRFIFHPSIVQHESNYTVLLVDATKEEIEALALFCSTSERSYDVYLYRGSIDDLRWLSSVSNSSDQILIRNSSKVTITGAGDIIHYSQERELIDHFRNFEITSNLS